MYQDEIGFSLKSIKNSLKKLGGSKKKIKKPSLLTSDAQGGVGQRLPLGFPVVTFTSTSGTVLRAVVNPQKPFMARKLVINTGRIDTAAPFIGPQNQVVITGFRIGTEDMFCGAGAVPVETFLSTATDLLLMTRAARPGIEIGLTFEIVGVIGIATQSIAVSATLIGDAVAQ